MNHRRARTKDNIEQKIISGLGYGQLEDGPQLERVRKEIKSDQLTNDLTELSQKSQRKKRRLKDTLAGLTSKSVDGTDQMKQLEWRLQILRQDRREVEKRKGEPMTFEQMYNRQKNKYLKFRNRQNVKVADPKYLDMIGSTQMRRERRRLESLERLDRHFEMLDSRIENHVENGQQNRANRKKHL